MNKKYSKERISKGIALYYQTGCKIAQASRLAGVPKNTLRYWLETEDNHPLSKLKLSEAKDNFVQKIWKIIILSSDELKKKIHEASPKELAWIISILYEKQHAASVVSTVPKKEKEKTSKAAKVIIAKYIDQRKIQLGHRKKKKFRRTPLLEDE